MQTSSGKEFEREIIAGFERIMGGRSMDALSAKLMTLIFIEPGEISMDDLALKTKYSLSAVSSKLTVLENLGFIERKKRPGSKKLYFFMKKNMLEVIANKLKRLMEYEFAPAKEMFPGIIEKYTKEMQQSKDERFKEQYKIMKKYVEDTAKMERITQKMVDELSK